MKTEQGILRLSITVTVLLAGFGIVVGLLSGSFSIVFDGVYSLADASMSGLALMVATLIHRHAAEGDDWPSASTWVSGTWNRWCLPSTVRCCAA